MTMLDGFADDVQRVTELHAGQTREITGEPYVTHPISVAVRLQRLGLDDRTVLTGLYHDVLEDTALTEEQLAGIHPDLDLPVALVSHDETRDENSRVRNMRTLLTLVASRESDLVRDPDELRRRRVAAYTFLADKVDNASAVSELIAGGHGAEVETTFNLADKFWWWETVLTTMRVADWLELGEAGRSLMSDLENQLAALRTVVPRV